MLFRSRLTRGSLRSSSRLGRKPPRAPQLDSKVRLWFLGRGGSLDQGAISGQGTFLSPFAPGAAKPRLSLVLLTSGTPRAKPQVGSVCPGQPRNHSRFRLQLYRWCTKQYPRLAISEVLNLSPCSSWEDERPRGCFILEFWIRGPEKGRDRAREHTEPLGFLPASSLSPLQASSDAEEGTTLGTGSLTMPGESQGWGSLVGCCLWGRTESDTTDAT